MATIKELESELVKAKKLVVQKAGEINRLRCLLLEVEPALAQANSQVEELRSAVDDLTSQKVSAEENFNQACKMMEASQKGEAAAIEANRLLTGDVRYEKQRRIAAENKAYELEKKAFMLASNHEDIQGVRAHMNGLRIDRHGEIA